MDAKSLLKLSAIDIADQVIKANGARKALTEFISEGHFTEDELDLLVETNEVILQRSVNEKQKYCDLTISLIKSRQMWSKQEMKLIESLALANDLNGDTEFYRSRVRELLVCLDEKDVLISVEDANNRFVVSEKKQRPMILAFIKSSFPGISTKRIPQRI